MNDLKLIELMIIANNNNHFQAVALAAQFAGFSPTSLPNGE